MLKILFVCLGNICRSPMAEAVFRDMAEKEGLDQLMVDSAGTGHWHTGKPPHKGTLELLRRKGISTDGLTARQLQRQDLEEFDYIIAMDESNGEDIQKLVRASGKKPVIRLLLEKENAGTVNVPDPYYTGNFYEVYDLILKGCTSLLKEIKIKLSN